jgi:hypothetical protein
MILKNYLRLTLFSFILLFIFSCEEESDSGMNVRVYSQAPVLRAVVKDSKGQIAVQKNLNENIYYFQNSPVFPIVALSNTKDTFIDMDFDGNKTASDIVFDDTLYSMTPLISLSTTVLLESADINFTTNEYNVTKYKDAIYNYTHAFSISSDEFLYKSAVEGSSINLASFTDTVYDARQYTDYNASDTDKLSKKYTMIQNFYYEYLSSLSIGDSAKYHAYFNSLLLLDNKKIFRAQQNTMPSVPDMINRDYDENIKNLPDSAMLSSLYNTQSNLAYWAIQIDDDYEIAYLASGNDGFDTVDISAPKERLENQNIDGIGFGTYISYIDREDTRCIFLANQERQLSIYGVWPVDHVDDSNSSSYLGGYANTEVDSAKTFDVGFTNTNADNMQLLLVSNFKAGLEIFTLDGMKCDTSVELNSSQRLNTTAIGSETYSSVVSSNQKIIYVADGANGIISVDISGSKPVIISTTALKNSEIAYNLHMVPNSNELYISTDNGVQIYNTDNTGKISYRGLYPTEGSRANTFGETLRVSLSKNHQALFVADITSGVKILDIRDSLNPKLCGVAYFSAQNIVERSAVRDVVLVEKDDGSKKVYIANDSNGLIVIDDADHLLFDHCKNLLD